MNNITIPKNVDAEISLLACVLMDGSQIIALSDELEEEDFYDPKNRIIYRSMLNLYTKGSKLDLTTVFTELKNQNLLDAAGGASYISDIASHSYTTSYIDDYITLVKSASLKRRTLESLNDLVKIGMDSKIDADEYLEETEKIVFELSKGKKTSSFVKMDEALAKVKEHVDFNASNDKDIIGLDTGFSNLNEQTLGFQAPQLIVLGARPGMGKSALAMNIATNVARLNKNGKARVAVFNLEMGYDQLAERMIATEANIDSKTIKSGKFDMNQSKAFIAAQARLSQLDIQFDDSSGTTIESIRTKCRKLASSDGGLDFVVIDYLQLVNSSHGGKNKSRADEVADISRQLKAMARELNVPVLALSQLSRKVEDKTRKDGSNEPQMSDLRESGGIEQDADIIMLLYRKGYYAKNEEARKDPFTELNIAKNRQGVSGVKIYFNFIGKYYKFEVTTERESSGEYFDDKE